ncbi:unnamed protein product [Closterium sp. NIES-53]
MFILSRHCHGRLVDLSPSTSHRLDPATSVTALLFPPRPPPESHLTFPRILLSAPLPPSPSPPPLSPPPRLRISPATGSSWAMAAVTAVELAYAVSRNASDYSQAPRYLSTQQVLSCGDSKKGNCTGGWPTTALDYVVKTTGKYGGMVTEGNYPYTGNTSCTYGTKDDDDSGGNKKKPSSCDTSKVKKATAIGIRSYESIDYYGWLGLILAVQVRALKGGMLPRRSVQTLFGVTSLASRHPTPGPPDCSAWDPQSRPSNPSATPLPSPYPPLPSQQGNRCGPVAALFGITIARLKALNPGLTCPKGAYPGQQICVQEGSGLAIPLCAQYHVIASPDTCVSIRQQYGLSWSTYFALNPGVFCANLYPAATVDGVNAIPSGAQICVKAAFNATINYLAPQDTSAMPYNSAYAGLLTAQHHSLLDSSHASGLLAAHSLPQQQQNRQQQLQQVQPLQRRGRCQASYTVVRGDFCARIIALKFQYNTRRMASLNNGYVCTNARLFVGLVLCTFR